MSDMSTGEMLTEQQVKDILLKQPERAKNIVSLTSEQSRLLAGKNRKERREFFRKNKKLFQGLSWEDLRKE